MTVKRWSEGPSPVKPPLKFHPGWYDFAPIPIDWPELPPSKCPPRDAFMRAVTSRPEQRCGNCGARFVWRYMFGDGVCDGGWAWTLHHEASCPHTGPAI